MRSEAQSAVVIPFPGRRASNFAQSEPKDLLETVYTAGAMPVTADDRATKAAVARLHLFGFFIVEEIGTDVPNLSVGDRVRRLRDVCEA